jgi:hypothetical protein
MALSERPIEGLGRIAAAGGGLKLDAKQFKVENAHSIVAAAAAGVRIIFFNTDHWTVDNLTSIASAGKSKVSFE